MYTPAKGGHWRGNDPSDPTTQGAGSYRCAPTLRSVQMDSTVLARYRVRFSSNIHLILALFQLETFLLCRQRLPQNWKILLSKGKPYFSGKHFSCVEEDHRDAGKWWEKKNLWRKDSRVDLLTWQLLQTCQQEQGWLGASAAALPHLGGRRQCKWLQPASEDHPSHFCWSETESDQYNTMQVTPASIRGQKSHFCLLR